MTAKRVAFVRYDQGLVDDVVISGNLFRMEQMDKDAWWVAIYRGKKRTSFSLQWDRKSRNIVATVTDDSIGCTDDSLAEASE